MEMIQYNKYDRSQRKKDSVHDTRNLKDEKAILQKKNPLIILEAMLYGSLWYDDVTDQKEKASQSEYIDVSKYSDIYRNTAIQNQTVAIRGDKKEKNRDNDGWIGDSLLSSCAHAIYGQSDKIETDDTKQGKKDRSG